MEMLSKINHSGLTLVLDTQAEPSKAAKVHDMGCSVTKAVYKSLDKGSERYQTYMDSLDLDIPALLGKGYGVTLCKCAKHTVSK